MNTTDKAACGSKNRLLKHIPAMLFWKPPAQLSVLGQSSAGAFCDAILNSLLRFFQLVSRTTRLSATRERNASPTLGTVGFRMSALYDDTISNTVLNSFLEAVVLP